jgi:hypothetical protein
MSRLDRLKEQHPDLNISLIDIISHLDPTDSYKYTEFLIKNFKRDSDYYSSNKDEFMGYMGIFLFGSGEVETLNEFERHSKANRIKIKDISQYKNFLELNEAVKVAEEIENRKKIEKEILNIHEDETWFILTPLSFEASKVYGTNTKWCVTQEKYWNQYLTTHRLIYVLNKKTDTKIAFSREFRNEKFQAWDQQDREVDPMFIDFIPDELFLKIRKELQRDKTTGDLIGWGDNVKSVRKIADYPISDRILTNDPHFYGHTISGNANYGDIVISNPQPSTTGNIQLGRIKELLGLSSATIGLNNTIDYNYLDEDYNYLDDLP